MNGLDLVFAEVKRRVGPEMDDRIEQLAAVLLPALNAGKPLEEVPTPPPAGTPTPKTAAVRTLVQGLVAVILTAITGVVVNAITSDTFKVFEWGSWVGLAQTAVPIVLVAVIAYIQRLIKR